MSLTEAHVARFATAVITGTGLLLAGTPSFGDVVERCGHGAPVQITVQPLDEDPELARRVTEQMFSEVSPADAGACAREGGPPRSSIDVRWDNPVQARIAARVRTPERDYEIVRTVDLEKIPTDGRPLALGIAADEMIDELYARLRAEPHERPAPPPAPVPPPVPVAHPPPPERLPYAVGTSFAFENFTAGLTLYGPDLRTLLPLASNVALGLRLGLRAPSLNEIPSSELELAAVPSATATLRIGSPLAAQVGIAAVFGADVLALRAESRAVHGPSHRTAAAVTGDFGMSFWQRIAPALRVTLDAQAGVPFAPVHLTGTSGTSHTVVGGAALGAGLGLLAEF